jgi:lipoprotein-releasing system ATP-binding protein
LGLVLRAEGLDKSFGPAAAPIRVLEQAGIEVRPGELVAVAGSSGSGKSTLLHVLGGLLHPDRGGVEVAGEDVYSLSEARRAALRNAHIGFVFQFHHLLPEFTALENVMMPALIAGQRAGKARERAFALLTDMGLASRATHRPGELSGGEQQRVAVARALVNEPRVVLADEPSGNLDARAAQGLHDLLEDLAQKHGVALVVATHSPSLARRASRSLVLQDGTLRDLETVEGWA